MLGGCVWCMFWVSTQFGSLSENEINCQLEEKYICSVGSIWFPGEELPCRASRQLRQMRYIGMELSSKQRSKNRTTENDRETAYSCERNFAHPKVEK